MKMSDAFPSRWLSQDDIGDGVFRLTIADVRTETVGQGERAKDHAILHFREAKVGDVKIKPFILSAKVNWKVVAGAYGGDTDFWVNKQLDFYVNPNVMYGDEQKGGIRIRIPGGAVPAQAPASATAPAVVDVMTLEQAIATAIGAGMSKEGFVSAMKLKGLTGYLPSKDTITARAIISEFQFAQNDTAIPF